jgi:lysophospholipase L1-like esterase
MIFGAGQTAVFIGDSITDCGRREAAAPYGNGYMNLVRSFATARRPDRTVTWVNRGISGDTIRDMAARWQPDAIGTRPDWLSVMIGINDVWRAFNPARKHEAVPLEEYEATLRTLLADAVTATGCRLILATPYLIEPDRLDPQRAASDRFGAVVRTVATDVGALLVDTQAAFDRVLESSSSTAWADDRVHPNLPGHAVLADAFLHVIDPS